MSPLLTYIILLVFIIGGSAAAIVLYLWRLNTKYNDFFRNIPLVARLIELGKQGILKPWIMGAVELAIITLWALWIGRAYLDFNPRIIPSGNEYGSAVAWLRSFR